MPVPQFRSYCFTINNFTEEEYEHLKTVPCIYACFQCEVAPETLTPHIQGYIYFKEKKSLAFLKRTVNARAHYEAAAGTPQQNRTYCSKEGGTRFYEMGDIPTQGARNDLAVVAKMINEGSTMKNVAIEHPEAFIKFSTGLIRYKALSSPRRDFKTEVFWYYGPTGAGKSYRASREAGPDAYYKMGGNKWWDMYDGHENVIIDDCRRDMCTFNELLRLLDRYPHRVEVKCASVEFVAKRVWITCPFSPRELWRNEDGAEREDIGQLIRRVDHVVHFPRMFMHGGDAMPLMYEQPFAGGFGELREPLGEQPEQLGEQFREPQQLAGAGELGFNPPAVDGAIHFIN